MNDNQSRIIAWLRCLMVIFVLIIHIHPDHHAAYLGMNNLMGGALSHQIYTVVVSALFVVCNAAVPIFFFLSGLLFFVGAEEGWSWQWWKGKVGKRARTLLVPYLIFNLLALANNLVMPLLNPDFSVAWANPDAVPIVGSFWNSTTACEGWRNILGVDMQLFYPAVVPLWFIRDLIVTIAISPLLFVLIKYAKGWFLAAVALLYICGVGATSVGINSGALLFFSMGGYFSVHRKDFVEVSLRHTCTIGLVAAVLLTLSTIYYAAPFAQQLHNAFFVVATFGCIAIADRVLRHKTSGRAWSLLSGASFFIFAVHMLPIGNGTILSLAGNFAAQICNTSTIAGAVCNYALGVVLILVICIALAQVLKKTVPWLYKNLCGGR